MGRVLVARHVSGALVKRLCALKTVHAHLVTDPTFRRMFEREARIASMLHHPNVVPVLALDTDGEEPFLVMDFFASRPLLSLIRRAAELKELLPVEVCAAIMADTAAGLHAAHELTDTDGRPLDVVHRDVTPSNVLVGLDGTIKVTDFGVARGTLSELETITRSADEIRGKLGYLSPEQLQGVSLDRRSDVFTMGIVLFELLTLKRVFPRLESEAAMLRAALDAPIPDVRTLRPEIPEALARVVSRALDRDRDQRIQTAAELSELLRAFVTHETQAARRAVVEKMLGESIAKLLAQIAEAGRTIDAMPAATEVSQSIPTAAVLPQAQSTQPSLAATPRAKPRTKLLVMLALVGLVSFIAAGVLAGVLYGRSTPASASNTAREVPPPRPTALTQPVVAPEPVVAPPLTEPEPVRPTRATRTPRTTRTTRTPPRTRTHLEL